MTLAPIPQITYVEKRLCRIAPWPLGALVCMKPKPHEDMKLHKSEKENQPAKRKPKKREI